MISDSIKTRGRSPKQNKRSASKKATNSKKRKINGKYDISHICLEISNEGGKDLSMIDEEVKSAKKRKLNLSKSPSKVSIIITNSNNSKLRV